MTVAPPVPARLWSHGPPSLDDGPPPLRTPWPGSADPTTAPPQAHDPSPSAYDPTPRNEPGDAAPAANGPGAARAEIEAAVRAAQEGSLEAFERLVQWLEPRLLHYLRQFARNPHDAEDLTQETFLKAYRGLASFDPQRSFPAWIFTIARRTAISYFRGQRLVPVDAADALPPGADHETPAALLAAKDDGQSLWALADRLKPRQREALWLHYGEDLSVEECARVMGLTQIHVKVLLHRGRLALAQRLRAARPQATWLHP